ncbi:hypothetical protein [Streptomyces sp. NPDC048252]|uniref:hypothetical protein n=1 Tax=Streptomyces sp. NPDC048252 TaxID=3154612 RepID=UPI0034140AA1
MNHTKRVLVVLTLAGAVLTMSGAAHALTSTTMANIRAIPAPADGANILGIDLGHILHGLGLGVGGQLLG